MSQTPTLAENTAVVDPPVGGKAGNVCGRAPLMAHLNDNTLSHWAKEVCHFCTTKDKNMGIQHVTCALVEARLFHMCVMLLSSFNATPAPHLHDPRIVSFLPQEEISTSGPFSLTSWMLQEI